MSAPLVILGAGESGTGAALLAKNKGLQVFVSDSGTIQDQYKDVLLEHDIPFEEGVHTVDTVLAAGEVIKSPGIPDHAPLIKDCLDRNIPVISELEFASRYSKGSMITITGTNGKTTTAMLTYHILKEAGCKVALAGNVGHSLARQVIDDPYDYYVVEVSSFQLDGMFDFRSNIAILLNITEDHLNRYDYDFGKYVASKFRITRNMTGEDCFIYFSDDQVISDELGRQQLEAARFAVSLARHQHFGAFLEGDKLHFNLQTPPGGPFEISLSNISLRGPHNMVNTMAASLAALLCKVPLNVLVSSLGNFRNVPHRLEEVSVVDGVVYINDSKATNVNSVFYALQSFDLPVVWIAGGIDKGNDYELIRDVVLQKVKALICLGVDNTPLLEAFSGDISYIREASNMEEAVDLARQAAVAGDVVLLSPACASFDLFKNYQDRGDQFRKSVAGKKKLNDLNTVAQ